MSESNAGILVDGKASLAVTDLMVLLAGLVEPRHLGLRALVARSTGNVNTNVVVQQEVGAL